MGPPSYMRSVVDSNVVMRRMPVIGYLLLSMYSYCSSMYSYCCLRILIVRPCILIVRPCILIVRPCILIVVYVFLDTATLTEVFPCFFLGCKANARV